jgi:hypothetical protein
MGSCPSWSRVEGPHHHMVNDYLRYDTPEI